MVECYWQRKTEKTQTETCPISTLSTYLAWPDLGINPGLHGVRRATNCLSYGMAYNAIIPNCHFHIFHDYFGSNVVDEKVFCVKCEISSSHGGKYDVQSCLLGYTAV
jgi:hypothetical protein